MKSSYKILGDFIRPVNNRNKGLITEDLRGLSMSKEFRKSTSNIVGTDLTKYKLVYKNQFACDFMSVIRVHKLPVVRHDEDQPVIVSPAYTVFEVIDENILDPQYLMMWFRRPEFDRYADFRCDSAIRGGFKWDELCEVELPVPSIEKQRAIVAEYNTVVKRIKLNEQLNHKLEETAQAIYKQWFVDFEFPNEEGKPYKSSGGKMVYNEELDKEIPEGWENTTIGENCEVIDCLHSKKPIQINDAHNILLQLNNLLDYGLVDTSIQYNISDNDYAKWISRIELAEGDCVVTNVGKDAFGQIPGSIKAALGRNLTGIRCKPHFKYHYYLIVLLNSNYMKLEVENYKDTGTIMQALNVKSIPLLRFVKSDTELESVVNEKLKVLRKRMELNVESNQKLEETRNILLSKMTKVEETTEKEIV